MLRIQSDQLAEQRRINERQTEVLALQAAELRESLAERKREAVERQNAQAARVWMVPKVIRITPRGTDTGFRLDLTVVNGSGQPVYDVKLFWYSNGEPYGMDNPQDIGTILDREGVSRDFMPGSDPANCGAALSFRDSFGVNWVKTLDGGAMHADSDLVPGIVKALEASSGNGALSPRR